MRFLPVWGFRTGIVGSLSGVDKCWKRAEDSSSDDTQDKL
jgi:hypothetical protein